MKNSKQKTNCNLYYKEDGKYTTFYIDLPYKDGSINVMIHPYMKDKKVLSKLVYKIKKCLDEAK